MAASANSTAAAAAQSSCPPPMKATSNGSWQGDNPLDFSLPLIIVQICLVIFVTRSLAFLLRPLRQPRVIAEIIGGILLGPSALGRSEVFLNAVFPKQSLTVLDTVANIGLLYFLFLVGLELDLRAIRRTGYRAMAIATAGICLPFVMGIGTSVVLHHTVNKGVRKAPFVVFMGVSLSITAFPVLARILAELKLLTTDVGRMAMSAAAVNDVVAWILLALAIALTGSGSPLVSLWVLLSGIGFVMFVAFAVRPLLHWMARRSPVGEPVKETYICVTLAAVLASGFVTDVIGIHALFGAFIIGVFVPKDGPFAGILIEKIEDIICGLFLPLYFVSSGLKTNVATIEGAASWGLFVLVTFTACLGKIGGTILVSLLCKMPSQDALALGFLMNTKGLVELIVLNIGKDRKVLNDETFAILVLMALFTTFITTPLLMAAYKPARRSAPYKHRAIMREASDSELRVLACFRGSRNIPTMINLIESFRGTRRNGMTVYAMHLMELSERSSAISMVHKARRNGLPFWNRKQNTDSSGDQLVIAFQAYQQLSNVTIRPMTAISDLQTIHEDVIQSAEQKRAAFILLPFHKLQQIDGSMESIGHEYRLVNQRILSRAMCSVGILVDRGLGGSAQIAASEVSFTVAVLFFGGKDDREALALGVRMAEHPGIELVVLRFIPQAVNSMSLEKGRDVSIKMDANEIAADEACINEFRGKVLPSKESIRYVDKAMGGKAAVVAAIRDIGRCNLFLVGQAPTTTPPLMEKRECPELGQVGEYLASSESETRTTSVLVVKQHDPTANPANMEDDPANPEDEGEVIDEEAPDTPLTDECRC